jgi:hypothetical protein
MNGGTPFVIGAACLFPPLDRRLKIPRRGASARLAWKVCEAGARVSFEEASKLLKSLADVDLSPKRVQLVTEGVGRVLQEERDGATQGYLEGKAPAPKGRAVGLLVATMDGGRVQTRQAKREEKWKEDKVGVVYEAVPVPERPGVEYHGPEPGERSVVGTLGNWESLGDHLSALADRRGYARAAQRVVVSDGAEVLRSVRERCFSDAVFILDWVHAVEHLHDTAVAGLGPGPKAEAWYEQQKDRLWKGRITGVIGALSELSGQVGLPTKRSAENDPRRVVANNRGYFERNRAAMDYPAFRKQGWPISSAIVESTIKQVSHRVKGSEKHWTEQGAEETLQVVTHVLSEDGTWENFWRRCPLAGPP